jgi:hypothetical protein
VFRDGDLNGDGVASVADFNIWRNGFGVSALASPATGDADGDGDVDGTDFARWQRGLGFFGTEVLEQHVPEPSNWVLAVAAALAIARKGGVRRNNRKNPY